MTDEIEGCFAEATVADFLRESSAREEVSGHFAGAAAFQSFVDDQIRAVRTAWIASETYMQPLVVLASHDLERIFITDDDETLGQFVQRMSREAKAMQATWTFLAKRTMVAELGPMRETEHDIDVDDPEAWQQALAEGLMRLGVLWFAERREAGEHTRRHGQMVDEVGTLGPLVEGARNQTIPLFEQILAG